MHLLSSSNGLKAKFSNFKCQMLRIFNVIFRKKKSWTNISRADTLISINAFLNLSSRCENILIIQSDIYLQVLLILVGPMLTFSKYNYSVNSFIYHYILTFTFLNILLNNTYHYFLCISFVCAYDFYDFIRVMFIKVSHKLSLHQLILERIFLSTSSQMYLECYWKFLFLF